MTWDAVTFMLRYWNVIARYQTTLDHYNDVIMNSMASQITTLMIIYSTFYSGADQLKHQSSASLAFGWGIHQWPMNSPHKGPISQKMFPFDDVIMPQKSVNCMRHVYCAFGYIWYLHLILFCIRSQSPHESNENITLSRSNMASWWGNHGCFTIQYLAGLLWWQIRMFSSTCDWKICMPQWMVLKTPLKVRIPYMNGTRSWSSLYLQVV